MKFRDTFFNYWPLVLILLLFNLFLGGLLLWNWEQLRFGAWDLGIHDQVLYLYSRTILVPSSITHLPPPFWDSHFRPTFVIFFLQYLILPKPEVFILLQVLIFSLGIIPLYFLTRRYLGSRLLGVALSLAYLLYPGALSALAYPGHSEILVATLVSWALYFYLTDAKKRFLLFFFLAAISQENISLYLSGLSLFLWIRQDRRLALICLIFSLSYGFLVIKYLIPWGLGKDYIFVKGYFESFTGFAPIFAGPADKIKTIVLSLLSFAFLPLGSLALLAAPALSLVVRLMSFRPDLWRMYYHYSVFLTPFLAYSSLLTFKFLKEKLVSRRMKKLGGLILAVALIILPPLVNFKFDYFGNNFLNFKPLTKVELKRIHSLLAQIPEFASISAQDPVIPWLTHREKVYPLHEYQLADYVVFDLSLNFAPLMVQDGTLLVRQLIDSRDYKIVYCFDKSILFKRSFSLLPKPKCPQFQENLKWL